MAGETVITVVGNLTADPEMRYTNSGVPFASFTIASTPRTFDKNADEWKDGEGLFLRATVWREFAEHAASSLTKGMRVIARGNLRQRSYDDKDGQRRTSYELDIDEIGPSLRYATAAVTRAQRQGGAGAPATSGAGDWSSGGGFGAPAAGQSDWGAPAAAPTGGGFGAGFDEEQPF